MKYAIPQLTVFIENRPGELALLSHILSKNSINIKSIMLAESSDFGLVRMIVNNPEKAKLVLKNEGLSARITNVLGVKIKDEVGTFDRVVSILSKNSINILYMYSFYEVKSGIFVFHVDGDAFDIAVAQLLQSGEEIVEADYFK